MVAGFGWLWCTNRLTDMGRQLSCPSGGALRQRHTEPGHPVEHRAADPSLSLLGRQGPGAKTTTDDGLVPEHGGLPERAPAVADPLLPPHSSPVVDHPKMLV